MCTWQEGNLGKTKLSRKDFCHQAWPLSIDVSYLLCARDIFLFRISIKIWWTIHEQENHLLNTICKFSYVSLYRASPTRCLVSSIPSSQASLSPSTPVSHLATRLEYLRFNDQVDVTCNHGYTYDTTTQDVTVTCLKEGSWDGTRDCQGLSVKAVLLYCTYRF